MATMSSYSELLSRPDQSLLSHLQGTGLKARRIVEQKRFNRDFSKIAYLLGLTHDFGKATSFFQSYIRSTGGKGRTVKKNHSSLSAFFCYHLLLKHVEDDDLTPLDALLGWYVVQRHHGSLTDFSVDRQGEIGRKTQGRHRDLIEEQIESIREHTQPQIEEIYQTLGVDPHLEIFFEEVKSGELFKKIKREYLKNNLDLGADPQFYLNVLFLYSVLLEADKLDASGTDLPGRHDLPGDLVGQYKKSVFGVPRKPLDKLRQRAADSVIDSAQQIDLSNRIFSITLPTGTGKTLTGVDAALLLRQRVESELGFTPRILYVLPFMTIIEQNHKVIRKVLENSSVETSPEVLLKHHHLSAGYLEEDNTDCDATQSLLLTDSWHSEIIVSTFVQFFESLITNRNARAKKFNNMANAIILLDEVQAIPRRYWKLVKTALQNLCTHYNSWVILMTATVPLIFEPKTEITELATESELFYERLNRVNYHFNLEEQLLEDFQHHIIDQFQRNPEKDFMIVLDTIRSSKTLYQKLKENLDSQFTDVEFIYLSTHILPQERLQRIKTINNSDKRKLIVTTQLVEAGVDIDIDVIYRDLAPLDSIIQAAGRCNREAEGEKGEVHVVKLIDDNTDRAYASYIYDTVLLEITEEILGEKEKRSEEEFNYHAARKYFKLCKKRGSGEEEILNCLRKLQFESLGRFSLIQEDVTDVSIYIEKTEEDHRLRKRVEEILETTHGYKRKAKMLPLKRKFYNRMINVHIPKDAEEHLSYLKSIGEAEHLYFIPRRVVDQWYHPETGFHFPKDTFDLRFIG